MNRRLIVFLLAVFVISAFAQTSIGFKNPENTTPLKDYRLPTWGYKTLGISLDCSGNYSTNEHDAYDSPDEPAKKTSMENFIETQWYYFHESEKQTITSNPQISFYHAYSKNKYTIEENGQKGYRTSATFQPVIYLPFSCKYFFKPKQALLLDSYLAYTYSDHTTKSTGDFDESSSGIHRSYQYQIKLGYSLGRVRNVTPVVRALRLNERLQTLNLSKGLSSEQIQKLANYLSQRTGYYQVYERAGKHFWPQVLKICDLENIPLADALYLTEIYKESLFNSYTGWNINVGMDWNRNYYVSSHTDDNATIGPFIELDWFHNFALDKQLSINLESDYKLPSTGNVNEAKSRFTSRLSIIYDWMIADRLLWTNTISNTWNEELFDLSYPDSFINQSFSDYTFKHNRNYFRFQSNFKFHIEDRIMLSASLFYNIHSIHTEEDIKAHTPEEFIETSHDTDEKSSNLGYFIRLEYFINRTMK